MNIEPTPMVSWGLYHNEHGLMRFLLIERVVFTVCVDPDGGTKTYKLIEAYDAAGARHLAVERTAHYEERDWVVGNYVWTHAIQLNVEEFLHAARGQVPWVLDELNAMIDETINHGGMLT